MNQHYKSNIFIRKFPTKFSLQIYNLSNQIIKMSLRQKQLSRKSQLQTQIKSVNLDINILNGLSKQANLLQGVSKPTAGKLSLNQLSHVLRNKNEKYTHLRNQKLEAKEWLKYKGVDFRRLNQQINQNARVSSEIGFFVEPRKPQLRGVDATMMRRVPAEVEKEYGFTSDLQTEFVNKQKQVALSKVIMNSLKNTPRKTNIRSALLKKIKGQKQGRQLQIDLNNSFNNRSFVSSKSGETSFEGRKNQYFDFVKSLSTKGFDESLQKVKNLKPFWKIVLEHVKTVKKYFPQLSREQSNEFTQESKKTQLKMNAYLMMKSLRQIEKQFQKTLPDTANSLQKLDQWVRDVERRNRNLRVWRNHNGQPSWALAFILLKAGRITEVKRVLQNVDRELLEQISKYQQSIMKQQPHPSIKRHDMTKYKDNFYNQILYVLQGNPKFDPQVIMDNNNTKLWIILRTLGIYRDNTQIQRRYQQLKGSIIRQDYSHQAAITKEKLQSYFYLGIYKEFIDVVELIIERNSLTDDDQFNHDDYFHLLTVLYYYPELWGAKDVADKLSLQEKYVDTLLQYMEKLRIQGYNAVVPSYLLLCPSQKILQVACKFIKNRKQYEQFDWISLRDLLVMRDPVNGKILYQALGKEVLNSLQLKTFNDILFAAEKYRTAFPSQEQSLYKQQKCQIRLLLNHLYFVQKKRHILLHNEYTQAFNQELFRFFEIDQRSPDKIEKLVSERDRDIRQKVNQFQQRLDRELVRNNDDKKYIKQVTLPYLFYRKFKELSQLLERPLDQVSYFKSFDEVWYKDINHYCQAFNILPTQTILQFLNSQSSQPIVGLYIYFLYTRIQRKKILCNVECDYSGLPAYVSGILKEVEGVERYYGQVMKSEQSSRRKDYKGNTGKKSQQYETVRNPLLQSPQYKKFMQQMTSYMNEYGKGYSYIEKGSQQNYQTEYQSEGRRISQGKRISFDEDFAR